MQKKSEEETQRKNLELYILNQNIQQLQENYSVLNNQLAELRNLMDSLDKLKDANVDSDMYATVSPGVYVKAKIKDTKNLMVNVGNNVVVNKNADEAKGLVEKRMIEISEVLEKIEEQMNNMVSRMEKLQEELS